jgi:transposase
MIKELYAKTFNQMLRRELKKRVCQHFGISATTFYNWIEKGAPEKYKEELQKVLTDFENKSERL